jgi:hypothetical protein
MAALRERIREGPPSLADAHKAYDDQCREELENIDREVVEVPVDMSGASPRGGVSDALRDTWPGPNMVDPNTGRQYPERELWLAAEELIDATLGIYWMSPSIYIAPVGREFTRWNSEGWGAYWDDSLRPFEVF